MATCPPAGHREASEGEGHAHQTVGHLRRSHNGRRAHRVADCRVREGFRGAGGTVHDGRPNQHCQLTDPFFEFGGTPPERALTDTAGECTWFSDYYLTTLPEGVESDPPTAERARLTVTPSGKVNVTTFYPPNPKTEDECGDEGPGNVAG